LAHPLSIAGARSLRRETGRALVKVYPAASSPGTKAVMTP
jgi:hypothetical protein